MLTLSCNVDEQVKGLEQMIGEDLPFTIARFLTMQAQSGQESARAGERRLFKLRNDWTTQNTKITPATKTKPIAEVYTDTENRKTGAGDYLPRQDEGGEKVPLAGHRFLAIPTRYLRRIAPGAIPDSLRPKFLLPAGAAMATDYAGNFRTPGAKLRKGIGREGRKKLGTDDFVAFVQYTKSGTLCIFVRHGGIGFHAGSQDAEPFYTLVPAAHIKARFPMEQLVADAVDRDLDRNFDRAAAEVLVNNALKSGLQVRF